MGFIKQSKLNELAREARRAIEAGRCVFATKLATPITPYGQPESIAGWAEMIEAVEACGWRLAEWAVGRDAKGHPEAYPLFRRGR